MDIPAIEAFVVVADQGSFGLAAAKTGMTPSGVSRAVTRLERVLGVQLLIRTTRSVRLTAAGIDFHARSKSILAAIEDARRHASETAQLPRGRLTITMSSTGYGRNRVIPVIAEFLNLHPQVEVHARLSDQHVDLVDEGVDLAVRIGHLPNSTMVATKIGETRFVLCGAPVYLSRTSVPATPEDLGIHTFVGFMSPGTANRFEYGFLIDGEVKTMQFPSKLTVDDGEALVAAALESIGLVMVVDYLVNDLIDQGRLIRLLREFEQPPIPINILYPHSKHPSRAAKALIEMLRKSSRNS